MPHKNSQRIVITGGSSGLGFGLARALVARGHSVGLLARNEAKLQSACQQLQSICLDGNDQTVTFVSADVSNPPAAAAAIEQLAGELSGIDTVINSAGILREGYFEDLPIDTFREVMDINLFGIINVSKAALPYLKASQGRLVNIASMAALTGVFGYTPYTAAKHALAGFTDSLRYELAPQGITVQLICPPEFDSPMVAELNKDRTPENRAHVLMIPMEPLQVIVDDTLKALEGRRFLTVTGTRAKIAAAAMRYLPGLMRRFADKAIAKVKSR